MTRYLKVKTNEKNINVKRSSLKNHQIEKFLNNSPFHEANQ